MILCYSMPISKPSIVRVIKVFYILIILKEKNYYFSFKLPNYLINYYDKNQLVLLFSIL